MSEVNFSEGIQMIKQDYQQLVKKYGEQSEEIPKIDELYTKFKNLKKYEAQFDRNEELKKQLKYWNNGQKTPKEIYLQNQIVKYMKMIEQLKVQEAKRLKK